MNSPVNPTKGIINRSIPPGIIIPELVYDDLDAAVAWLCKTFGFKERLRIGAHRSQLVFGQASMIVVAKSEGNTTQTLENPEVQSKSKAATHSVMVQVEDVNQHYEQAKQNGARIISPPIDYPFGERQYTVEDFGGHRWTFSQSIADIDPGEWGGVLLDVNNDE